MGPRLGAVILCGGQSSRMGRSKAELSFGGEPLWQRLARSIEPAAAPIVLSLASDQRLVDDPGDLIIARDIANAEGPLMGIALGLRALVGHADLAFVTAVDLPFMNADFVRALQAHADERDAVVPVAGGIAQPLAAIYAVRLHAVARRLFDGGERSAMALLDQVDALRVEDASLDLACLRNINSPGDYQAALAELRDSVSG